MVAYTDQTLSSRFVYEMKPVAPDREKAKQVVNLFAEITTNMLLLRPDWHGLETLCDAMAEMVSAAQRGLYAARAGGDMPAILSAVADGDLERIVKAQS